MTSFVVSPAELPLRARPVSNLAVQPLQSDSHQGDFGELPSASQPPKELSFLIHRDANRFSYGGVRYHVLGTSDSQRFQRRCCSFVIVVSAGEGLPLPPLSHLKELPDRVQERLAQLTEEAESQGWHVEPPRLNLFHPRPLVSEPLRESLSPPREITKKRSQNQSRRGSESPPSRYLARAQTAGLRTSTPESAPGSFTSDNKAPRFSPAPAHTSTPPVAAASAPPELRPTDISALGRVRLSAPPDPVLADEHAPKPSDELSSPRSLEGIPASPLHKSPTHARPLFTPPCGPHGKEPQGGPSGSYSMPGTALDARSQTTALADQSSDHASTQVSTGVSSFITEQDLEASRAEPEPTSSEENETIRRLTEKCRRMGWIT
jgi:hypothetical protein